MSRRFKVLVFDDEAMTWRVAAEGLRYSAANDLWVQLVDAGHAADDLRVVRQ